VTTQAVQLAPSASGLLRRAWLANKPLAFVGVAMIGVLVAAAAGLLLDDQVVTGAPAWLKPAKFAISVCLYTFTFVWLLNFVSGHTRLVRVIAWATAAALGIEMVLIVGAAAVGETSHFNVSTPLHSAVWSTMGAAIVVAWVANLALGVLLLRQRIADPMLAWSLRLGVFISAVGMGVAFFMTSPTAQQLTAARDGEGMSIVGAHSVGVPDGGPGLPVVGWSTIGGDLRPAHFLGLHALQALPLLGLLLLRFAPSWLRPQAQTGLVWTFGLAYVSIVVLLTWQALRAQSLVHPDALTLGVFGAIVAATAAATAVIVGRAWSGRSA
jgi:hypothetical protein